jgi:hypothetical protein
MDELGETEVLQELGIGMLTIECYQCLILISLIRGIVDKIEHQREIVIQI